MSDRKLLIQGMHGMGDCLHQRAILKQVFDSGVYPGGVWLETSWPAMYHDFVAEHGLKLLRRPVALRTQTKNVAREMASFTQDRPRDAEAFRVMYHGPDVMRTDSKTVLEAMCRVCGADYRTADYRLPVPEAWYDGAVAEIVQGSLRAQRPILVYRPLVERPEWRGSAGRNADPACYAHLFAFLREHFYVVSVADLAPGQEWIVGPRLKPDVTLHGGELTFEGLAALYEAAALVFCSSGFSAILGPAVSTPTISIVGGYEHVGCHDSGARFAPFLSIGPRDPCHCWSSACPQMCDKRIDMIPAIESISKFVWDRFEIKVSPLVGSAAGMFDPPEPQRAPGLATPFGPPPPDRRSPAYQLYLQMQRAAAGGNGGQKA